jgi:hypothetical protein
LSVVLNFRLADEQSCEQNFCPLCFTKYKNLQLPHFLSIYLIVRIK